MPLSHRSLGLALTLAAGALAGLAQPTSGASEPPCSTNSPPALILVAPHALPVGYPGGFYVDRPRGALPGVDDQQPVRVAVQAAAGGRLVHAYSGGIEKRDETLRWPLLFAREDGPASITITYGEGVPRSPTSCVRTLSTVVKPRPVQDPHIQLGRPVVSVRVIAHSPPAGTAIRIVNVRVSGTIRQGALPVRVDLDGHPLLSTVAYPEHGHFSARFRYTDDPVFAMGRTTVSALYPGTFRDTFPCHPVFAGGGDPFQRGCFQPTHAPG